MDDTIERFVRNDFSVVKLAIVNEAGHAIKRPFLLKNGANVFKCIAIYADGTSDFYNPYWTCPIILRNTRAVDIDVWAVQGKTKKFEATVSAAPNHERYTELTCWVFPPKRYTGTGNAEIPHDSIGFDYARI